MQEPKIIERTLTLSQNKLIDALEKYVDNMKDRSIVSGQDEIYGKIEYNIVLKRKERKIRITATSSDSMYFTIPV